MARRLIDITSQGMPSQTPRPLWLTGHYKNSFAADTHWRFIIDSLSDGGQEWREQACFGVSLMPTSENGESG